MLLTIKEVAGVLRVGRSCIYWLLKEERMHGVRIGFSRGTLRIDQEELHRFIAENTVRRRGRLTSEPRQSAPNAFTHLNASRLREAWAEQGVEQPTRRHSACGLSARQDADKP
jgi:excisionase family DNA binding protein